ncbi:major royal jelly protein 1 [Atheta coriaria]|uniref:major royal jelly protein 1 n=1 Tax=Dalotia coriaria TaxID=877792 RepID=UPI0031F37E2B
MLAKIVCLGAVLAVAYASCDKDTMRPIEWTGGNYEWPCGATKKIYVSSGKYLPKNVIATRGQIYHDDLIVALPRFKPGVPATLAKVSLKQKGCEATLTPFPCWSSQDETSPDGFINIVDLFLDNQDILWCLDIGVTNTLESPIRRAPPKVIAISMKTGKLLKTLNLSGLVAQASRLQYVVVEYSQDGRPFCYISDAATRSILVFDIAGNKGYRVVLPKAVVAGANRRDVLYIALIRKQCRNHYLVFTYLSSGRMFQIRTDYLRSGSAAGRVQDLGPKPDKLVILGNDLGAALFFRYEGHPEVYRWDSNTPFCKDNFQVVYKSPNCLLATHAMADLRRQRIRVLESNFPDFIQNTVGCGAVQQVNLMSGSCN